jgi:hypothetical protein
MVFAFAGDSTITRAPFFAAVFFFAGVLVFAVPVAVVVFLVVFYFGLELPVINFLRRFYIS